MYVERSKLRLTEAELQELVAQAPCAHIATVSADGEPHVTPLGVVLEGGALYMVSMRRSRRDRDIDRGSPVAVCIDHWGSTHARHRGAVFYGSCRTAPDDGALRRAKTTFAAKYYHDPTHDPSRAATHRWLILEPERVVTWDFRKIPDGADGVSTEQLSGDVTN